jgi:quercetin dioxygenase-like cupin family protein
MEVFKGGARPTRRAPKEYFTGAVWQDPIIEAPEPARLRSSCVTFEPGARTAWHSHPFGQTLYVVAGTGRAQSWGGPIREIRAGDVVWFAPGEKHWHGAAPTTTMVHVAMQEAKDGKYVDWQEYVSAEDYAKPVGG